MTRGLLTVPSAQHVCEERECESRENDTEITHCSDSDVDALIHGDHGNGLLPADRDHLGSLVLVDSDGVGRFIEVPDE